jgi:hypothetical protein
MISRRSCGSGRSTKNISSNRPLRSSSCGSERTSLAVATTNTRAGDSCSQYRNWPTRRVVTPVLSVPEPASPFSISSIHSTHGARVSAVDSASRNRFSDWPRYMPKTAPMSRRYSGSRQATAIALADRDLPQPGTPTNSTPRGGRMFRSPLSMVSSGRRRSSQCRRPARPPTR